MNAPSTSRFTVGMPPPPPPRPQDEEAIIRRWTDDSPVVSILCPTYQHVDFVAQALEGFFGQRTTFEFEVVVRDDGSTDGTVDVIAEFAARFPRIMRCIMEPENRYPAVDPLTPLLEAARGRFVALCEGDDYWTDPYKLQKQVLLLLESGAAASHHGHVEVRDGRIVAPTDVSGRNDRDRDGAELRTSMKSLLTRTIVVRKSVLLEQGGLEHLARMWAGDSMVTAMIGASGGSLYAGVLPAVYRVHAGGVSTQLKNDHVLWLAKKATDARSIGDYLSARGFADDAEPYFSLARDRATGAIVGQIASALRTLTQSDPSAGPAPGWRRVRGVLRLTSVRSVASALLGILGGRMRSPLPPVGDR